MYLYPVVSVRISRFESSRIYYYLYSIPVVPTLSLVSPHLLTFFHNMMKVGFLSLNVLNSLPTRLNVLEKWDFAPFIVIQ